MGLFVSRTKTVGGSFVPPSNQIIWDDFDYTLSRIDSASNKNTITQAAGTPGHWAGMRDANDSASLYGYIYVVSPGDVPGALGATSFPGSVQRALLVERTPDGGGGGEDQSDVYLQFNTLPANVYYQYWIALVNASPMVSNIGPSNKHLYPTNNDWPAETTVDEVYIELMGHRGAQEFAPGNESWDFNDTTNRLFFAIRRQYDPSNESHILNTNSTGYPDGGDRAWQNLSNDPIPVNTWAEIVTHIDVSGSQGIYEVWRRYRGGDYEKITEWIGGVTSGFDWTTSADDRNGQAGVQWPSIAVGEPSGSPSYTGDNFLLFQDLNIVESEADLWVGADNPSPSSGLP